MSSSTTDGHDPSSSEAHTLLIKVMSPISGFPRDLTFRMPPTSTIKDVKGKITASLESSPPSDQQRLIYRGKMMLEDDSRLETVLGIASGSAVMSSEVFTFHLMLRPPVGSPGPATAAATSGRVAPMFGERGHARVGDFTATGLERLAEVQQQVRQRGEFIASRLAAGGGGGGVGSGSSSGISIPGLNNNGPVLESGTTATMAPGGTLPLGGTEGGAAAATPTYGPLETQYQAVAPNQQRGQGGHPATQQETTMLFGATPRLREPLPVFNLPSDNPHPFTGDSTVFLLQDASGRPRALLLGPPGGANTPLPGRMGGLAEQMPAPVVGVPDLRGLNLPPLRDIAGLGAIGGIPANNLLGDHFGGAHIHHRVVYHGLEGPRQARQFNLAEIIRGVRARASHFWLAVRLAVFVVLFTGSGGWRRMLYLGSIAVVIFVWQTGILEPVFRPLIDAINPPPPPPQAPVPAEPAPRDPNQPNEPQQNQPGHPAVDANGNRPLDPVQTAQMLIEHRQERFREVFRGIERGIMIFLASLIPGLHERHVNAVEQRQRDEAQRQQLLLEQQQQQQPELAEVEGGRPQVPPPAPQPEPQQDEVEIEPMAVL